MRRKRERSLPEWDDGRTIASMNVEGMPWYKPQRETLMPESEKGEETSVSRQVMTREESRYYTWGAVKAALLVTGVMCGGIILFVLFCQFIWFS